MSTASRTAAWVAAAVDPARAITPGCLTMPIKRRWCHSARVAASPRRRSRNPEPGGGRLAGVASLSGHLGAAFFGPKDSLLKKLARGVVFKVGLLRIRPRFGRIEVFVRRTLRLNLIEVVAVCPRDGREVSGAWFHWSA